MSLSTCLGCGQPFTPKDTRQRYCQRQCRGTGIRPAHCRACGGLFQSSSATHLYCSFACRRQNLTYGNDPGRDTLASLLQTETLNAIGLRFHVTRERVRQWATRHGLVVRAYRNHRTDTERFADKRRRQPAVDRAVRTFEAAGWVCTDGHGGRVFRANGIPVRVHLASRRRPYATDPRYPTCRYVNMKTPVHPYAWEVYTAAGRTYVIPEVAWQDVGHTWYVTTDGHDRWAPYIDAWPRASVPDAAVVA